MYHEIVQRARVKFFIWNADARTTATVRPCHLHDPATQYCTLWGFYIFTVCYTCETIFLLREHSDPFHAVSYTI